jgi:hypothetical protein
MATQKAITATQKTIAEAEELAALLGNLTPHYRRLVERSDFRSPLLKLAGKLIKEVQGHPAAARLQDARAEFE